MNQRCRQLSADASESSKLRVRAHGWRININAEKFVGAGCRNIGIIRSTAQTTASVTLITSHSSTCLILRPMRILIHQARGASNYQTVKVLFISYGKVIRCSEIFAH